MRNFILFLLFTLSVLRAHTQLKMTSKLYNKFLTEYQTNNTATANTSILLRHDTLVHPLAITARYIAVQKVFPDEDAVQLIRELNPQVNMADDANTVAGDTQLKYPNYPMAKENVMLQFKSAYLKDASPNDALNQTFVNESNTFNQIFQNISQQTSTDDKPFYDSLTFFNNQILPHINSTLQKISSIQMQYFNTELTRLIEVMRPTKARRTTTGLYMQTPTVHNHAVASYIIADFYDIASPIVTRKTLFMQHERGGTKMMTKNYFDVKFKDDLTAQPFACNLYIYEKDENGNRRQDPAMDAYDVWVGPKMGYITRSSDNDDPEKYGLLKMGNPASTLPFNIGFGQWVIIMKKNDSTGTIYSKSISITTETEFEPSDPDQRKVCYNVD